MLSMLYKIMVGLQMRDDWKNGCTSLSQLAEVQEQKDQSNCLQMLMLVLENSVDQDLRSSSRKMAVHCSKHTQ
jgi:hypothetical protein